MIATELNEDFTTDQNKREQHDAFLKQSKDLVDQVYGEEDGTNAFARIEQAPKISSSIKK